MATGSVKGAPGIARDIKNDVTSGSNVTINYLYFTKIGNMAVLEYDITLSSDKQAGFQLIKSMPIGNPIVNNISTLLMRTDGNMSAVGVYIDNFGGSDGVCTVTRENIAAANWRGSLVLFVET